MARKTLERTTYALKVSADGFKTYLKTGETPSLPYVKRQQARLEKKRGITTALLIIRK